MSSRNWRITLRSTGLVASWGFHARRLKRTIQRELQYPLAMEMLSGKFHPGYTIKVDRGADGLYFNLV
jgi:ATP-dependent Clp protease ATP-binding subunit ClpA